MSEVYHSAWLLLQQAEASVCKDAYVHTHVLSRSAHCTEPYSFQRALIYRIIMLQEHLAHRNEVSIRDLPARTVRASHILKTLMSIKQPNRLSLCLMLLPDVSSRGLTPSRTFPDHLCSLQHLTSITILIDEPRTNSYFMELGAKEDLCMVAKCLEAICLSAAPVHTVVAGGLRCAHHGMLPLSLKVVLHSVHTMTSILL